MITGDLKQSDRSGENGLNELMTKIGRHRRGLNSTYGVISVGGIRAVELLLQDVERSAIVKQVLALYEEPVIVRENPTTPTGVRVTNHTEIDKKVVTVNIPRLNTTVSVAPNVTTSFEMVCVEDTYETVGKGGVDDAALIPKQHSSKYYQGENYGQYSTGKWTGW